LAELRNRCWMGLKGMAGSVTVSAVPGGRL
jgi:hypothetical protein